jgi:hypothetical protein
MRIEISAHEAHYFWVNSATHPIEQQLRAAGDVAPSCGHELAASLCLAITPNTAQSGVSNCRI